MVTLGARVSLDAASLSEALLPAASDASAVYVIGPSSSELTSTPEIDHVPATDGRNAGRGDNFGWNRLEGDHRYQGTAPADVVDPVDEISHDTGACAVVGGYVYRGTKIPALDGWPSWM